MTHLAVVLILIENAGKRSFLVWSWFLSMIPQPQPGGKNMIVNGIERRLSGLVVLDVPKEIQWPIKMNANKDPLWRSLSGLVVDYTKNDPATNQNDDRLKVAAFRSFTTCCLQNIQAGDEVRLYLRLGMLMLLGVNALGKILWATWEFCNIHKILNYLSRRSDSTTTKLRECWTLWFDVHLIHDDQIQLLLLRNQRMKRDCTFSFLHHFRSLPATKMTWAPCTLLDIWDPVSYHLKSISIQWPTLSAGSADPERILGSFIWSDEFINQTERSHEHRYEMDV
jgi:hypothetical protein